MHNDTEDKMQRGWRGLKLGARIVIMLSLVVCCIAHLLFGGVVVHCCRDGKFENRAASLRDLAVYILAVSPASHIAISDGVCGGEDAKAKGILV